MSVHVEGKVGSESGWVMDFADVSDAMAQVLEIVDHSYLNEIEGLGNPTSEVLAAWLWERVAPALPGLSQLVVKETCTTGCVYRGD